MSGSPGSHCTKTGAVMKAFFKVSNEVWQESENDHGVPFRVNRVNGTVRRVVVNKPVVEIGKTQERLHVLDFPQFGPILDDFDLVIEIGRAHV